ncbi:MAG: MMPL family transporter [Bacilli bacterium]|nr:MMPL family transporter [Bacilli bacterium]
MKLLLRFRYVILGLFLGLFAIGVLLIPQVTINYDGTTYLPSTTNTRQALLVMEEAFGNHGSCEIMVEDVTIQEAGSLALALQQVEGVASLTFFPTQSAYYHDEKALYQITFDTGNYDATTKSTLEAIEALLTDYDVYLRGESINATEYNKVIQKEIIQIVLIIVPIVLLILFLATTSWIEPVLFIIIVIISVLINMGTNAFFPSISYMTHATCGILQLALCMDYSVMMLHSYKEERLLGKEPKNAITSASKKSFVPIVASMATTIAGFVALLFMQYRIGFDVGIVLIKGTLISFATTFLLTPGLILMFAKMIEKTRHQSIFKPLKRTYSFLLKSRFVMPVLALLVIGFAFFMQTKNTFIYSENNIVYESPTLGESHEVMKEEFGINNPIVIIVPKDLAKQGALVQDLATLATNPVDATIAGPFLFYSPYTKEEFSSLLTSFGVSGEAATSIGQIFDLMSFSTGRTTFSIVEMVAFIQETPLMAPEDKAPLTPFIGQMQGALASFEGDEYDRIIVTTHFQPESEEAFSYLTSLEEKIALHFDEYYLLGESVGIFDIKNIIDDDYWKVTVITIVLIFVIILLSFQNFLAPLILIILILGSTWINMALPAIMGSNLLYIGYIIVSCIMLGATIDYAILYTHKYRENRETMDKTSSLQLAFQEAKHTVFTSGLILIGAGYTLGWVSSIPSIAVFGSLIGRGAITSVVLVLFVLPQTLLIFDKIIIKKWNHKTK